MARTKRKINPLVQVAEPAAPAAKIYKTAAYVRLSVEDSGKPGTDTIEGQKALLTSFIESKTDKAEAEEAERLIAVLEQEQHESKVYTAENRFLTEFRSFMGTDTLIKEMASALIERIYVDAEKNIDIRLRYRDEYMALLNFIEGRTAV